MMQDRRERELESCKIHLRTKKVLQISRRCTPPALFIFLVLGYLAIFYTFEAPYLWHNLHPAVVAVAVYITLVALSSLLMCLVLEPGFLPCHLDSLEGNPRRCMQRISDFDVSENMPTRPRPVFPKFHEQNGRPIQDIMGENESRECSSKPCNCYLSGKHRSYHRSVLPPSHWPTRDDIRISPTVSLSGRKAWLVYKSFSEDSLEIQDSISSQLYRNIRVLKTFIKTLSRGRWPNTREGSALPKKPVEVRVPGQTIESCVEKGGQYSEMLKKVRVGSTHIFVRWCPICQTYPKIRAYHCSHCGRCCEDLHFHCSWIANDIGRRTLPVFLAFLSSAIVFCIYSSILAALHLYWLHGHRRLPLETQARPFRDALSNDPAGAVIFVMGSIGALIFLVFFLQLIICIALGQTVLQFVS